MSWPSPTPPAKTIAPPDPNGSTASSRRREREKHLPFWHHWTPISLRALTFHPARRGLTQRTRRPQRLFTKENIVAVMRSGKSCRKYETSSYSGTEVHSGSDLLAVKS